MSVQTGTITQYIEASEVDYGVDFVDYTETTVKAAWVTRTESALRFLDRQWNLVAEFDLMNVLGYGRC